VVHTSASRQRGVDVDVIDRMHRARGWNKVGYHYVIIDDTHPNLADGTVQMGRSRNEVGAHVYGLNKSSLGICCVGHGDDRDFTRAQKTSLVNLLAELVIEYNLSTSRILGHREINKLIDQGVVSDQYRTTKSCPGNKVSLPNIRGLVDVRLRKLRGKTRSRASKPKGVTSPTQAKRMRAGIKLVSRHVSLTPNAQDAWNEFRDHPEIREILKDD